MKKIIFFVMFIVILLSLNTFAFAGNIAVIVNDKSPVISDNKSTMEVREVRDIFLGKTKVFKGTAIKAVNQKDKALLSAFLQKVCNMHVSDYQSHWVRLELEQGLSSPRVLETSKDVIRFVQNENNAVGYVLESEVKSSDGIRIVLLLGE